MIDLSKITKNGKAMYLAYDHGIEHGPADLIGKSIDPDYILNLAVEGGYTGVILQKGIALKYYEPFKNKVPLIMKLNGKSRLVSVNGEPFSPQICSVREALEIGAVAVGYTVYIGSEYETRMLQEFAKIEEDAHSVGIPVIGWMYPRGSSVADDSDPEITAYAARIGLEMGADIVKIKYCGSEECFKKAVEAAGKTKVVLSGGAKTENPEDFLEIVKNIMSAGALGVAVGRNIWQNENAFEISKKLKEIIFDLKFK